MSWRISIGIGLKIDDKFFGFIMFPCPLHSEFNLLLHGFHGTTGRCKRIYVTIGTATITFGAITIGTGKTSVYNHFIHPFHLILIFEVGAIIIIILFSEG